MLDMDGLHNLDCLRLPCCCFLTACMWVHDAMQCSNYHKNHSRRQNVGLQALGDSCRKMLSATLRQSLVALADEDLVRQLESFELNDDAISALNQLVFVAEHKGCFSAVEEDAYLAQMQEYESEAARIQQQLDIIGVREEQLSAPAVAALQQLAGAASQLNLAHATDASMTAAWATLVCQDHKARNTQAQVDKQVSSLQASLTTAQAAQQEVTKALDFERKQLKSKAADLEVSYGRVRQLPEKVDKWQHEYKSLSDKMKRSGWRPELSHHALVKKSAENQAQAAELSALKATLTTFQDLPPSQLGAELRLRQAQEQLASVTARLQRGMSNLG